MADRIPLESLHIYDDVLNASAVLMQNVSVYRGKQEVLHDIDLCIDPGVFLGLIGPNGGGKTTLLNVIVGKLAPTEGIVEVFGQKPTKRNRRRQRIGYVPQYQEIPEHFPATVLDVVLMGAYAASPRLLPIPQETKVTARHLLAQVRMDHLADQPVGKLSGGQQQRVMIARALITHPDLLLLDEPLRGLDSSGQGQFLDLLLDLKQQYGLTVIMVSHNIKYLTRCADRIACLNRTIHWHDRSELINHEVLHGVFKCELEDSFALEDFDLEQEDVLGESSCDSSTHWHDTDDGWLDDK